MLDESITQEKNIFFILQMPLQLEMSIKMHVLHMIVWIYGTTWSER